MTIEVGPPGRARPRRNSPPPGLAPLRGRDGNRAKTGVVRVQARADYRDAGTRTPRGVCPLAPSERLHEADLPAQEAQARPHPRVPRPHAARRAGRARAQAPARQGPQAPDRLGRCGRSPSRRERVARSAAASRAAPSSSASTARAARTATVWLVSTRVPARGAHEGPRLGLSVSRKVGGAVDRNRVKRLLREAFWRVTRQLPDDHDFVVVARPEARELVRARGPRGHAHGARRARVGRRGGEECREAVLRVDRRSRPIVAYQRLISPPLPRALQVRAELLGLRRAGDGAVRHTARAGPRGLAPAALQSVEPRRVRPRRASASSRIATRRSPDPSHVHASSSSPTSSSRSSTSSSALSCSSTTTSASAGACRSSRSPSSIRALLLPLTLKQFKSMRKPAALAPQIKKLQEKYKDDKQRLNQEMMKFYQEHQVNPLPRACRSWRSSRSSSRSSTCCRTTCALEICGQIAEAVRRRPPAAAARASSSSPTSPTRPPAAVLVVLIVLYIGSQLALDAAHVGVRGQEPAPDLPGAAVRSSSLHHQLPGRPARLLDHDEPLDDRAAVHRAPPASDRRKRRRRPAPVGADDEQGRIVRGLRGGARRRRRAAATRAPRRVKGRRATAAGGSNGSATETAPQPKPSRPRPREEAQEEALGTEAIGDGCHRTRPTAARRRCSSASSTRWTSTRPSRCRGRRSASTRRSTATDLGLLHRPPRPDDRRRPAPRPAGRRRAGRAIGATAASSSTPRATASAARGAAAPGRRGRRGRASAGRPVALDAMTPSERRVVHEYLRDRGDVETYSEGNEPDRHLVVSPRRPDADASAFHVARSAW